MTEAFGLDRDGQPTVPEPEPDADRGADRLELFPDRAAGGPELDADHAADGLELDADRAARRLGPDADRAAGERDSRAAPVDRPAAVSTSNDSSDDPRAANAHVAAALAELDVAAGWPPADQVAAFAAAHETLQATLARIDDH